MDPVYLIWPMTDHPAIPDKDWQKTQRQKYQTAECGHWNMPADSHAVLSDLGSTATDLNFTEIPPLELMSRSLAECLLLADELALSLNPTFVGDGTEIRSRMVFDANNAIVCSILQWALGIFFAPVSQT
jgi:hypothetical protein